MVAEEQLSNKRGEGVDSVFADLVDEVSVEGRERGRGRSVLHGLAFRLEVACGDADGGDVALADFRFGNVVAATADPQLDAGEMALR